jgi:hypothetical protein
MPEMKAFQPLPALNFLACTLQTGNSAMLRSARLTAEIRSIEQGTPAWEVKAGTLARSRNFLDPFFASDIAV